MGLEIKPYDNKDNTRQYKTTEPSMNHSLKSEIPRNFAESINHTYKIYIYQTQTVLRMYFMASEPKYKTPPPSWF